MFKILKKVKFLRKLEKNYPNSFRFIREVVHILEHREVKLLAPFIAFFILLSFIPIITLIFEVVFLTINNNNEILNVLNDVLPAHVYTILVRLIDHNFGHVSIMTISNGILLYVASQIYSSFYTSYLIIFKVNARPHVFKEKIISLINTLLLILLIFFLSIITIFSSYIYQVLNFYIFNNILAKYFYNYINLVLSIMIITSIVTFMMYSIPDIRQRFKDVIQGALFVTFGWIIVSIGFKTYSDNFGNYQNVYKTFASIIVFVTWIYLISYVLIIGIVLNRAKISMNENGIIKKNSNEYTEGSERI